MKRKNLKKMEACILSLAMIITCFRVPVLASPETTAEAAKLRAMPALLGNSQCPQNPVINDNNVTTWDCVYFGYYKQDIDYETVRDEDGYEKKIWTGSLMTPIKWRVLRVEGNKALLLSDRILDNRCFDDSGNEVSAWINCSLRKWLNEDKDGFYNTAFDQDEKNAIIRSTISNTEYEYDPYYDEGVFKPGESSEDSIFLLSKDDVENINYGFIESYYGEYEDDNSKFARNTAYAESNGAQSYQWEDFLKNDDGYGGAEYSGNGTWWLRTSDSKNLGVDDEGRDYSANGSRQKCGVRPALYLDLSSESWSDAGRVCSDGTETVVPNVSTRDGLAPYMDTTGLKEIGDRSIGNPVKVTRGGTDGYRWDCVYFGNYIQDAGYEIIDYRPDYEYEDYEKLEYLDNGHYKLWTNDDENPIEYEVLDNGYCKLWEASEQKRPIKWRVLKVEGNKALLLSERILDCRQYNESIPYEYDPETHMCTTHLSWNDSQIRAWLNDENGDGFYNTAFNEDEKKAVISTGIDDGEWNFENEEEPDSDKIVALNKGLSDNKVFLISRPEMQVDKYLGYGIDAKARTTGYADYNGAKSQYYNGWFDWWLRGASAYPDRNWGADGVTEYGNSFYYWSGEMLGVRPAVYVNLNSDSVTYAGTVFSDGEFVDNTNSIPYLTNASVVLEEKTFTFDGTEKKPGVVSVSLNGVKLIENVDYTVDYFQNNGAGKGRVILRAVPESEKCRGSKTVYFDIAKAGNSLALSETTVSFGLYETRYISGYVTEYDGPLSYSITQALTGCSVDPSGAFSSGGTPGECKVRIAAAGDANHESAEKEITVTVKGNSSTEENPGTDPSRYGNEFNADGSFLMSDGKIWVRGVMNYVDGNGWVVSKDSSGKLILTGHFRDWVEIKRPLVHIKVKSVSTNDVRYTDRVNLLTGYEETAPTLRHTINFKQAVWLDEAFDEINGKDDTGFWDPEGFAWKKGENVVKSAIKEDNYEYWRGLECEWHVTLDNAMDENTFLSEIGGVDMYDIYNKYSTSIDVPGAENYMSNDYDDEGSLYIKYKMDKPLVLKIVPVKDGKVELIEKWWDLALKEHKTKTFLVAENARAGGVIRYELKEDELRGKSFLEDDGVIVIEVHSGLDPDTEGEPILYKDTFKDTDNFFWDDDPEPEKSAASVIATPATKTLIYSGLAQELVTAGMADGGELQYAIGSDAVTAPIAGWSASIPTAIDAGTYYVWYKVAGDADHEGTKAGLVEGVSIVKRKVNVTAADQTIVQSGAIDKTVDSATLDGAVEGHVLTSVILTADDTMAVTDSGRIIPSNAVIKSGDKDVTSNYDITYVDGKLMVTAPGKEQGENEPTDPDDQKEPIDPQDEESIPIPAENIHIDLSEDSSISKDAFTGENLEAFAEDVGKSLSSALKDLQGSGSEPGAGAVAFNPSLTSEKISEYLSKPEELIVSVNSVKSVSLDSQEGREEAAAQTGLMLVSDTGITAAVEITITMSAKDGTDIGTVKKLERGIDLVFDVSAFMDPAAGKEQGGETPGSFLILARHDKEAEWVIVGTGVYDSETNTVSTNVKEFSEFAAAADSREVLKVSPAEDLKADEKSTDEELSALIKEKAKVFKYLIDGSKSTDVPAKAYTLETGAVTRSEEAALITLDIRVNDGYSESYLVLPGETATAKVFLTKSPADEGVTPDTGNKDTVALPNSISVNKTVKVKEYVLCYPEKLPCIGQSYAKVLRNTDSVIYMKAEDGSRIGVKKVSIKKSEKTGTAKLTGVVFADGKKLSKKDLSGGLDITIEKFICNESNADMSKAVLKGGKVKGIQIKTALETGLKNAKPKKIKPKSVSFENGVIKINDRDFEGSIKYSFPK